MRAAHYLIAEQSREAFDSLYFLILDPHPVCREGRVLTLAGAIFHERVMSREIQSQSVASYKKPGYPRQLAP
jgi:hypothetical protein